MLWCIKQFIQNKTFIFEWVSNFTVKVIDLRFKNKNVFGVMHHWKYEKPDANIFYFTQMLRGYVTQSMPIYPSVMVMGKIYISNLKSL